MFRADILTFAFSLDDYAQRTNKAQYAACVLETLFESAEKRSEEACLTIFLTVLRALIKRSEQHVCLTIKLSSCRGALPANKHTVQYPVLSTCRQFNEYRSCLQLFAQGAQWCEYTFYLYNVQIKPHSNSSPVF
jgi:hypothetical protein